jgi:MFS family permease
LAIVAMTATMALSSPVSGRLAEQWGARLVVAAGGLLATAGVVALMRLPSTASAVAVGLCLLPVGLGLGLSTGPANAGALSAVAAHEAGMAAATVSMLRYVGSIGGTVILSFAFASGAGAGARHRLALWIYVAALLISATLGGLLPPTPPASPALGPRPR